MARMVPFPMLPTESSAERRLYERFLTQLPGEYVVYHSVDWVLGARKPGEAVVQGEADFIIAHPIDGVLVLEAKGGELDYDPATRRWTQSGRSGRHHLDEDPFHQARDEMHSLVEILSHQPGWDTWRPSYGYGVAFPDGLLARDAHPGARAEWAIDRDDMDRLESRVKEIMNAWRRPGRRFGAAGMEALERALGFRVEIRTPLRMKFDQEDRKIVELTDDQAYVLSYVTKLHRAAIVGPAGSGKTMLALAIASRLAGGGNDTLLTCFNWRLADYLKENTREIRHAQVIHFHELCRQMAKEAGLTVPDEPTEDTAARDHFERVLPDLLQEGARPANLRNTKPIHEFVSVFYGGDAKPATHGPAGPPVEILGYKDDDDLAHLLALVLKNLEGEDVPLEDVVVLTPARRAKSALRQRDHVDGYELSDEPEPGKVLTCTVHGFKGLERPVVIVAEIGQRHQEDLAKYLYVGGSRARNHLIVLAAEPTARKLRQLAGVQAS